MSLFGAILTLNPGSKRAKISIGLMKRKTWTRKIKSSDFCRRKTSKLWRPMETRAIERCKNPRRPVVIKSLLKETVLLLFLPKSGCTGN